MALARVVLAVIVALSIASGCGTSQPPSTSAPRSTAPDQGSAPSATVVQFDPQWMGMETPQAWTETDRRITGGFQQFGLRPVDEAELPRKCNGCGVRPPTAFLTAYAPGSFDAAAARTGESVALSGGAEGFFRASRDSDDAVLAWEYAQGAWATVRGRTTLTSEPARMAELAGALRAGDRTAIRLPLSIPGLPESLPLAEISVNRGDYGTTLHFGACGGPDVGVLPDCYGASDSMRVQIWPKDGYFGHIQEQRSVPARIGGRDGLYDPASRRAAVQVRPGMLVVFELSGPFSEPGEPRTPPQAELKDILATVVWASDPADEQTWLPVADWVAPN